MLKAGDRIIIERTANGWIVRPEWPRDGPIEISDIHVFQNLDYDAYGAQSGDGCLVGFLLRHFKLQPTPATK